MTDFNTTLQAYLKHAVGFEDLNEALAETLKTQPERLDALRTELENLRDSRKLAFQDYAKLEVLLLQAGSEAQAKAAPETNSQWREAAYWAGDWPQQAAIALTPGTLLAGRYRLEHASHSRPYAEVWKAVDTLAGKSEKRVSVHVLLAEWSHCPQALNKFLPRLEQYCRLQHEHLLKIRAAGHSGGRMFVGSELVPDMASLLDLQDKYPTGLPLQEVQHILQALNNAYDYALQQGLPELYLAPADIYYDPVNKSTRILDFGLPVLNDGMSAECGEAALCLPNTAYRSCESLNGDGGDKRDASYAFGCLAYELLGGRHPFGHKSAVEARDHRYLVTPLNTLNKQQSQVLLQALNLQRDARPTPADFINALLPRRNPLLLPALIFSGALLATALIWIGYHSFLYPQRIKAGVLDAQADAVQTLHSWPADKQVEFLEDGALRLALVQFYLERHRADIMTGLQALTPKARDLVLNAPEAADFIESKFAQEIDAALESNQFAQAEAFQSKLADIYPDNAERLARRIEQRKLEREIELAKAYQTCLQSEAPLQTKTACLLASRPPLAALNPQHPLLDDALAEQYAVVARTLLENQAYQAALTLIADWTQILPAVSPQRETLKDVTARAQNLQAALDTGEIAQAEQLLRESLALYPEEAHFQMQSQVLADAKAQRLHALEEKYQGYLQKGSLLPSASGEDLFQVRTQIQAIDPKHPLLRDADLHQAFFDKIIETAGREGNTLERVSALFNTWDTLFVDSEYFQAADQETRERAINRVALHYLLKAEKLPATEAADYLRYAAELKPVQSVREKLEAARAALKRPQSTATEHAPQAAEEADSQ